MIFFVFSGKFFQKMASVWMPLLPLMIVDEYENAPVVGLNSMVRCPGTRATVGAQGFRRDAERIDAGVDVALADAARDDLGILGTEVEDDDLLAHAKGEVFACGRKTWRGKSASHAREEGS